MSTLEQIKKTTDQYVDQTTTQLRKSFDSLGTLLASAIDDRDAARGLVRQCQAELELLNSYVRFQGDIDLQLLETLKNEIRRWDQGLT